MRGANRGDSLEHRKSVYDGRSQGWAAITHEAPDELIGDLDFRTGKVEQEPEELRTAARIAFDTAAWKTIVRFVWHNATTPTWACIYFGIAARHVDSSYEKRMLPAEVVALNAEGKYRFSRARKLFGFRDRSVVGRGQELSGYTPLAALLEGEHGEWRNNVAGQEMRRSALVTIIRAAWQDIETRNFEHTLKVAFKNFTVLVAEDRDLLAWVTQTEFGKAFKETRAAFCARRKRRVRTTLELNGCTALTAPGGKSEAAIATYRKVQQGNHNRAGWAPTTLDRDAHAEAVRELEDHDDIPIRAELRDLGAMGVRAYLRQLAEQAEQRRLGALCGVDASDISLAKIKPTEPNDHE
jgi:hypothetical protein